MSSDCHFQSTIDVRFYRLHLKIKYTFRFIICRHVVGHISFNNHYYTKTFIFSNCFAWSNPSASYRILSRPGLRSVTISERHYFTVVLKSQTTKQYKSLTCTRVGCTVFNLNGVSCALSAAMLGRYLITTTSTYSVATRGVTGRPVSPFAPRAVHCRQSTRHCTQLTASAYSGLCLFRAFAVKPLALRPGEYPRFAKESCKLTRHQSPFIEPVKFIT